MLNLEFSEKCVYERLKNSTLPLVIYGMGNGADKVLDKFSKYNIEIYGIMASDDFCRYQNFKGYTVKKLSDFENELDDFIVCLCFGSNLDDVMENIISISKKHTLLVPNVSLFGDEIVDDNFISENKEAILKAYERLYDDKSKEIFEKAFHFLYTGELKYLEGISSNRPDNIKLLSLNDNEDYLDLGAYNGDTIEEFLNEVNSYSSITALEPNIKNYNKLCENTNDLERIELINKGISNKTSLSHVSKSSGRMAHLGEEGIEIETISVDELDKNFTYIKCDVEGMEKEMLEGAKNTLSKKPKLCVSAYHKPSDIFNLINMICSINNEYKIYLRKEPYIPLWDLNIYAK